MSDVFLDRDARIGLWPVTMVFAGHAPMALFAGALDDGTSISLQKFFLDDLWQFQSFGRGFWWFLVAQLRNDGNVGRNT